MRSSYCVILWAAASLSITASSDAQTISLRQQISDATSVRAGVGDTVGIDVHLSVGSLRASGVAVHVALPVGVAIVGDTRPFAPALFADGVEFANELVAVERSFGLAPGSRLLTYAVVLGPSADRHRSGSGALVSFRIVITGNVDGPIQLVDNPAHQSFLVLDDGRSELSLRAASPLHLAVGDVAAKRFDTTWGAIKQRR